MNTRHKNKLGTCGMCKDYFVGDLLIYTVDFWRLTYWFKMRPAGFEPADLWIRSPTLYPFELWAHGNDERDYTISIFMLGRLLWHNVSEASAGKGLDSRTSYFVCREQSFVNHDMRYANDDILSLRTYTFSCWCSKEGQRIRARRWGTTLHSW